MKDGALRTSDKQTLQPVGWDIMGDVDDLQNIEEATSQRVEAEEEAQREALRAEFQAQPLADTAQRERRLEVIAVAEIATNFNLRQKLDGIEELARSIHQRGLHTPLEVREHPDEDKRWLLVSGHRRLAALRLLEDMTGEPVHARCEVVSDIDEAEHYVLQLLENDHQPLQPKDWARGIRMCLNVHPEWDAAKLASSLGKDKAFVQKYLRLLELPDEILRRLEDGDLSFSAADLLRKATASGKLDAAQAHEIAEDLTSGERSLADVREEIAPPKPAAPAGEIGPDFDAPDSDHLDDWGTDAEGQVPDWQRKLEAEADKLLAADRAAEAQAQALSDDQGNETADGAEPQAEPEHADAYRYLLGRLLREWAPDEHLEFLGIERDAAAAYAAGLSAQVTLRQLGALGRLLSERDEEMR